jgi:hypothetical protein
VFVYVPSAFLVLVTGPNVPYKLPLLKPAETGPNPNDAFPPVLHDPVEPPLLNLRELIAPVSWLTVIVMELLPSVAVALPLPYVTLLAISPPNRIIKLAGIKEMLNHHA